MSKKFLLPGLIVLSASIAQLFLASPALANCEYAGQRYNIGDKVGPYVCTEDGWK